jgi:hypothetical protein
VRSDRAFALKAIVDLMSHAPGHLPTFVNAIRDGVPAEDIKRILDDLPVPIPLKHDLWRVRFPRTRRDIPDLPVALLIKPKAATEIFRQVIVNYQSLSELGPRERTPAVTRYLVAVEGVVKSVTQAYAKDLLTAEPRRTYAEPDLTVVSQLGSLFAHEELWPISPQEFGK